MKDFFVYALRHWIEMVETLASLAFGGVFGIILSKHLTRDLPRRKEHKPSASYPHDDF